MRGIVSDLTTVVPALALQAATGLVAVIVLLIVMNWFFHKVYWGGWISLHNRRKRDLLGAPASPWLVFWGLVLLGASSVYREGFEIVLFLQSYYLKMGHGTVLDRRADRLRADRRDGRADLLGAQAPALPQDAHRHRRAARHRAARHGGRGGQRDAAGQLDFHHEHPVDGEDHADWAGVWFSIFPNWETIVAQVIAAVLVVGSYFLSGKLMAASARGGRAGLIRPAASRGTPRASHWPWR